MPTYISEQCAVSRAPDWLKEPLPKAVLPRQSLVTSAEVAVEEGADEGAEADAPGAYAAPVLVDPWVETVVNVSLAVTMKNSEGADTVFSLDQVPAGLAQMTANNYKVPSMLPIWFLLFDSGTSRLQPQRN